MLMHFNDTRMGIEIGILGNRTEAEPFWRSYFLCQFRLPGDDWISIDIYQQKTLNCALSYLWCSILVYLNFVVKNLLYVLYYFPFILSNKNNLN